MNMRLKKLRLWATTVLTQALRKRGFMLCRTAERNSQSLSIPDGNYYAPLFSPWLGFGEFSKYYEIARPRTLVSSDRCWILYSLCRQCLSLPGDVWECGVYKGGTAAMLAQIIFDYHPGKILHLFDTFEGMPETDSSIDYYKKNDFNDTSADSVAAYVRHEKATILHPGFIPDTFIRMEESEIAFAHVDVDIMRSVSDCCEFIFPRLAVGGVIVFDDYGFPRCAGARKAVDDYFRDRVAFPVVLPTGQAFVIKTSSDASARLFKDTPGAAKKL